MRNLTVRELEVLRLLATGLTRGEIAVRLDIAEDTVRNHTRHVYEALEITGAAGSRQATLVEALGAVGWLHADVEASVPGELPVTLADDAYASWAVAHVWAEGRT